MSFLWFFSFPSNFISFWSLFFKNTSLLFTSCSHPPCLFHLRFSKTTSLLSLCFLIITHMLNLPTLNYPLFFIIFFILSSLSHTLSFTSLAPFHVFLPPFFRHNNLFMLLISTKLSLTQNYKSGSTSKKQFHWNYNGLWD